MWLCGSVTLVASSDTLASGVSIPGAAFFAEVLMLMLMFEFIHAVSM